MDVLKKKRLRRQKIKMRIRKKIRGTAERPRLSVFRSNSEIYAQIIDDLTCQTLVAVGSLGFKEETKGKTKIEVSKLMGQKIAQKAIENNITKVVFDRNGYLYHGRIKAFAESAKESGLII